jgi:hypothetical protein
MQNAAFGDSAKDWASDALRTRLQNAFCFKPDIRPQYY